MHCTSTQHVVACKKERTAWRQNLGRQKGGATRAGAGDTAAVPQADVTAHINDTAGLLASAEKTAGKNNASSQNEWKKNTTCVWYSINWTNWRVYTFYALH